MISIFAADLDGTLLGNPESEWRFHSAWAALREKERPLLVYNTGRDLRDVRSLISEGVLPEPDAIIGGVGTLLEDARDPRASTEFSRRFGEGWNLAVVEEIVGAFPRVVQQPPSAQHPYKSSWRLADATPGELDALRGYLREAGVLANVVYSCDRYLDVLPDRADKGKALAWYAERRGIPIAEILVAGDTGNDTSMFLLPEVVRLVVENALPELLAEIVRLPKYFARGFFADGVLDGLEHYGVIS